MNSDPHFFHNMIMLYLTLGKHQVKFLRLNIIWIRHYGILLYCRTYLKKYIQFNIFLVPWVLCYAKSLQLCPALYKPMDCIACQAPLSMGFPRQEYWSGLPCSPPGDLPDPGIELASLLSSALASRISITSSTWEAHTLYVMVYAINCL